MRPPRPDIPLPPFPPGVTWIGGEPPISERITARGPLLVHFFEVGELSSVRTLPFVAALHRGLDDAGLTVLGVHSPRSGLVGSDADLEAALGRLDVPYAVANDDLHRIWHAYGCEGWPSTFVWRRGGTLGWAHFGEGAYHETEAELRAELEGVGGEGADAGDGGMPPSVLDPPPDRPEPAIEPPSPELFPGGAHDRPWHGAEGESLAVDYTGAGAWAAFDGCGMVGVRVDDEPVAPVEVSAPGLYELVSHPVSARHELTLRPSGSVQVWSLAFAPGLRPT